MIKGGYYIKARCIQESGIALAPPHVREIWDWILKECNHTEKRIGGTVIKRGECMRSYNDIIDGLKWRIGYREERYTKSQCEIAMKVLKKATMITTTKTTRGMIIKVLNYDKFQDPRNYESHNETETITTRKPQQRHTINKNDKNVKNDKNEILAISPNGENAETGKEIEKKLDPVGQIFDIFYKTVNPALNWGNKTSRSSAEWLIAKFGLANTKRMVEMACAVQGKPYAPVVTTPYQMKLKLAELKLYFEREKQNNNSSFTGKSYE